MTNSSIIRGLWLACILAASVSAVRAQSVIVSPAGGDIIAAGKDRIVSWNPKAVTGNVSLSLWDGEHGKWSAICKNIPASQGMAVWHVPSHLTGTKFRVKLSTDKGTLQGSALSRTFFTVGAPSVAKNVAKGPTKNSRPAFKTLDGTPRPNLFYTSEKAIHPRPLSNATIAKHQMVTLSPNPTHNDILCSWPGEAREIALVDMLGNIVQRHPLVTTTSSFHLATQGLPKGNYYVRVAFTNGTIETHPLAVQ